MAMRDTPDVTRNGGIDSVTLAAALEASPTPMVVTDARRPGNPIVWANEAFEELTGYQRAELYGRDGALLWGPASDPDVLKAMDEAARGGRSIACELFNYRKDGTAFWNGMTIAPVRDADGTVLFHFSAQADMTDKHRLEVALKRSNDDLERQIQERTAALETALAHKTALLHEVDHRVKNNLQVIFSLMLLKARRTPEGTARDALQAMAERIGALSTAHRMLYAADDTTQFDFRDFAGELLGDLTAGLDENRITVDAEIEPIACTAAMAAPLALLMHELAGNALRHAFPEGRQGKLRISAHRAEPGMRMVVEDDGIGLADDLSAQFGFGRSLVEMVTRQLRGDVRFADAAPGLRVEVAIPIPAAGNA